jgi:hypothetical protein
MIRAYLGLFQAAATEWLGYRRTKREITHMLITGTLLTMMRETMPALVSRAERET